MGSKGCHGRYRSDSFEMDYDKLANYDHGETKVVLPVILPVWFVIMIQIFAAVEQRNICFASERYREERTVGLSYLRMPLMLLVPNGMEDVW